MKGGLKKKNVEKLLFQPIYDMIMHPDTHFSVFIVSSLKGFMISMQVTQEASEYFNRNSGGNFTIPVTSFLLKFAIVTTNDETLPPFSINGKNYPKSSEPKEDFYQEAILQQKLWLKSIGAGKIEVCPSVIGLAFLKNPTRFFSLIKSKLNEPPDKFLVLEQYLFNQLKTDPSWEIGIIVQSLVENSSQIGRFIDDPHKTRDQKNEALIYAGAQLIRLFISYKVIHFDCHLGNILVVEKDENIKCFIIDFGLVCVLRGDLKMKNENLVPDIENKWISFSNQLFPNVMSPPNPKQIIKEIFLYMLNLDLIHLQTFFSSSYSRGQMTDLYNLINKHNLFEDIYDKYVEISTPNPSKTSVPHDVFIQKNKKSGHFELIEQPINDYTINYSFLPDYCCTKKDCMNGAVAGTACCIGSCALLTYATPLVSTNVATGLSTALGATTGLGVALTSEKMDRGGKKSKPKKSKKNKKYKKTKTKKIKNKKYKK
jgi:hypothetical protein